MITDEMSAQQPILDAIYHLFHQAGEWPTFNVLDHHADTELNVDASAALSELEPGLALFDPHMQPGAQVALSVAGMLELEDRAAEDDLKAFWALLHFALEEQAVFKPDPTDPFSAPRVDSDVVRARVRVDGELLQADRARRAFQIMRAETITASSSGPDDAGSWTFTLGRDFRRWREATNVTAFAQMRRSERTVAATPPASDRPGGGSRIFVSYAHRDKALAVRFTDFLRAGCDLREDEVFMTARPGQLEPGANFIDAIRQALDGAALAVLILTPAYYESRFCLAELGAIWGTGLPRVPLLVSPLSFAGLDGVQLGTQAERINDPASLDVIRDLVSERTGSSATTPEWNRLRDGFLNDWDVSLKDGISPPTTVAHDELTAAQADAADLREALDAARAESERRLEYASRLHADNDRLRAGGDVSEPQPQPAAGDPAGEQIAEALNAIDVARQRMAQLPGMVRAALYRHYSSKHALTVGGPADEFDPTEAQTQVDEGFLTWDPEGGGAIWPRFEQPEIEEAKLALDRVRTIAFDGDPFMEKATADPMMRPILKDQFGIDDAQFELLPTWRALGFV